MKAVRDYGGRFLAQGKNGMWYEMDDWSARKKASQGKSNFRLYHLS